MPPQPTASTDTPATLVDLLDGAVRRYGASPLLGEKHGDLWTWTTYRQLATQVDRCRGGLGAMGIGPGDRVALISDNRLEWIVTAYAAFGLGAAVVPMTPAQAASEWHFIVADSRARAVLCATPDICHACGDWPGELPNLDEVICFARSTRATRSYDELLELGRSQPAPPTAPAATDAATVLYTSGTTGQPKGVVLSHANLCANVAAVTATFPLTRGDRSLSLLPWAHAFGQTCELHTLIGLGASLAVAESREKLVQSLAEVQPSVLISVPTIFHRIVGMVNRQMVARPRVIRKLFVTGMKLSAKSRRQPLRLTERAALATAERMILSRIRHQLGGKLRYAISGGAALSARASDLFETLGIPIYEGYGLTEASPVVCANSPRSRRLGTVGKPLPNVRVTVDRTSAAGKGQGELIVYGPSVMTGYLDRPEATAAAFTDDGGLRTGDIGLVDDEGFVRITGHLSERYKLANGKYVDPAGIEQRLRQSPYIDNLMVHGDGRDYNVALVVVDLDALNQWASQRELLFDDTAGLLASDRVNSHILAEMGELSGDFRPFERVRKVTLIATGFATDNDMLTSTLKLKRQAILAAHGPALAALYDD